MKTHNGWTSRVRKLYERLLGSRQAAKGVAGGLDTLIDGATAVAAMEACIADAAGLARTFPADVAARAWESERSRQVGNGLGHPRRASFFGDGRAALAGAIGASLSGLRASAFVSGPDLARMKDHLRFAANHHLPLLIHVGARASGSASAARGTGHEDYHGISGCGCLQFFACNVQQAVDFTLVAHRAAELALLPAALAMDVEQTALAPQEARLPQPASLQELLGSPRDRIEAPSPAQKLIFGSERRRVPASYDVDEPMLLGGFQGTEVWALGAAAQRVFFEHHLAELVQQSLREVEALTGRPQELISSFRTEDAQWVLMAQGSAVETLEALADRLRQQHQQRIGVIGVHCLSPFPAAQVLELIRGKAGVAVLERVASPEGEEPPLLQLLRTEVSRALENGRFGSETHPGWPAWRDKDLPRFRSVIYGLGGCGLRPGDLAALGSELDSGRQGRIYLGIEMAPPSSPYPKRQALSDRLRRAYPDVEKLGLRSKAPSLDLRPQGALTVGIHQAGQEEPSGLSHEAPLLLHRVAGGNVRSRASGRWERFAEPVTEVFTYSSEPLRDPGDEVMEDIAVVASGDPATLRASTSRVRRGGELLFLNGSAASPRPDEVQAFAVEEGQFPNERLLGALAARLAHHLGLGLKRFSAERRNMLAELPEEERVARLGAFQAGLEGLRPVATASETGLSAAPARPEEAELPMAVRRLQASATPLASLPRFWDQVGVLYHDETPEELAADPFLAVAAVPPLTSTFRDFSASRSTLPALDPGKCTGCGACWTWCPEAALAPVAIAPAALLEAGITMARADALRPVASQLAQRITREIKAEPAPQLAGEALRSAFQWLQEKMPLAEERRKAMEEAQGKLVDQIGDLPLAKTVPFFDEAEDRQKGAGRILSLAVNPSACKGCGICAAVCEPGALEEVPQDVPRLEEARRRWRLWEQLPDTPGDVIDRAREHPSVGPAPAMLLSRSCLLSMAPGDGAEAGSGERLALRLALACIEYHQQPRLRRLLGQAGERREQLEAKIRERLEEALPLSDLDALAAAVEKLEADTRQIPASRRVDTRTLSRQVELARALTGTVRRLREAAGGMGRCRVGLAVAASERSSWLGAFPDNPFSMPAVIDPSGDTAGMARGLAEGQWQAAMESFVVLKKAEVELNRPEEAAREMPRLEGLNWRDLDEEERQALPPLLLVGNDEVLASRGVFDLLEADLPIKVLALSELGLAPGGAGFDLGFTTLASRKAFVAQTSISESEHFYRCVRDALAFPGPAVIHVHAARPRRHGFDPSRTVEQAALAVRSRAFVLFHYNPSGEGVFGLHIDLEGNPELEKTWVRDPDKGLLTPAHWAATESRFRRHIRPLEPDAPAPTPLADYLMLPRGERRGKTPFFTLNGETKWTMTGLMLEWVEQRVTLWRTLQELAGVVTPFTEKIREEAERAVAETHQAELQSLRNEYEKKIQSLGEAKQAEIAERIRNQLLVLTGYKR